MLRKYKNAFLKVIENRRIDPAYFRVHDIQPEGQPGIELQFQDTSIKFAVWNARTDFDQFQCRYVRYAPRLVSSLNVPVLSYTTFDEILKVFRTWLESIEVALENKATPDLWLQTASYETLVGSPPTRDISTEQFSVESIYQLRLSIQELRLLVVGEFTPTQEQLKVIDDRLDYLSDALERLNQFDWKALLLSTLIGIATTLSLDTQTGKALYQLFLQAFRSAVHLLSS